MPRENGEIKSITWWKVRGRWWDKMNFVQPIRDPALVEDIANYLKDNNDRNYIMFLCGIYTGLRISDILKLKVKDVKGKKSINIHEKKTGKQKTLEINPTLKKALAEYCKDKDGDEYLVKSRVNYNQPINRSTAYRILHDAAKKFGLDEIGTHTLRKTFGYHFYKQTKDVVTLQQIFNHSHPSVTLRYIGINQETTNEAIRKFKIY
jgi:integrase